MAYQVGSAETMTAEPQRRARGLGAETKHSHHFPDTCSLITCSYVSDANHIQH
jgi:hypothetical protein